jgi:hypothetical protein
MKRWSVPPVLKRPLVAGAILAAAWAVALLLVAVPSWRTAMAHHREVQALEKGLAELDSWTVAGMWLGRSLAERSAATTRQWQEVFPDSRLREDLYLELAGVADRCGVENFSLEEIPSEDVAAFLVSPPEESVFGGSVYGVPVEVPRVSLESYRVKASFAGNYRQAADFLGRMQTIRRALSVHNLVFRPDRDGIRVDMELDVYVSQQS